MNVEQFATELKVEPAQLVKQLQAAGVVVKGASDELSDQDKTRLLDYLRGKHGTREPKTKITLTRKQSSEIKTADSAGRTRTVQVEVRKKRVLVKREGAGPDAVPGEPMPSLEEAPVMEAGLPPEPVQAPVEMPAPEPVPEVAPSEPIVEEMPPEPAEAPEPVEPVAPAPPPPPP
jgi:translation initiation factor IF-2